MNRIKENRFLSFLIVFAVYIISGLVGIAVYRAVDLSWQIALLIADAVATAVVFVFSIIFSNASVYDPYWSVQPPFIIAAFMIGKGRVTLFTLLVFFAVLFWAVRLTANWAYTFSSLTHQDWRYTMLCENTGRLFPIVNFIGIHMVPTLVVYTCVLPAVYAVKEDFDVSFAGVLFLCLSFSAAVMQGVADIQMHKYRKRRIGQFIRNGLWKYSRHPNYLGEILMWWGIALSVFSQNTEAWHLLLGAVLNTILFLFVSIPLAEKRQSRKEGYIEYKKQTRILLPIKKFAKT